MPFEYDQAKSFDELNREHKFRQRIEHAMYCRTHGWDTVYDKNIFLINRPAIDAYERSGTYRWTGLYNPCTDTEEPDESDMELDQDGNYEFPSNDWNETNQYFE